MKQTAIPYMQIHGGSSKGLYFLARDLPGGDGDNDKERRNQILLDAMGRDARQIDGLGGADPLTSKAAIVSASNRDDADIDYLFVQIVVGENRVDTTPNCGNILAGVGAFAVETGLVKTDAPTTSILVNMVNTGKLCELVLQTPNGAITYEGDAQIDGVPGTSAPVICNYLNVAGAVCGELLPTGNLTDVIDDVEVTCIDNGMPVVVLRAADFGISGDETPKELNANDELKARLESIRLQAGPLMNLGDVAAKAVPKMSLVSAAKAGGLINTRTFIPHKCHAAVGVLGAVSVATACILPGTVTEGMVAVPGGNPKVLSVEHPSGEFSLSLEIEEANENDAKHEDGKTHAAHATEQLPLVRKAGVLRTARLLSKGELYVPASDDC